MKPNDVIAKVLTGGFEHADEVVAALDAAGFVIMPKEATQKMICAALDEHDRGNRSYSDVYRAMTGAHQ